MKLLKDIYLNCLEISAESFKEYGDFTKDVIHSSAYRWLGISIGLRAIKYLKLINENGIGEGREYVTNPPNQILDPLKKAEFNLPNNACAYPFDNFNYYPTMEDYNVQKRQAVPGGGAMLSGGDPSIFN